MSDGFLITASAIRTVRLQLIDDELPTLRLEKRSTHFGDSRVDRESPKKRELKQTLTAEAEVWDAAWATA